MNVEQVVDLGTLFIIAAPSGAGKTSLVDKLVKREPRLVVSVSHTTRPKRPAEIDGENYFFIPQDEFKQLITTEYFIEHAQVFDNFYGTSKQWVSNTLQSGKDVILEIDWQGAAQIRQLMPDCISIFILPPTAETLAERLRGRGQDDESTINYRLEKAKAEMSHWQDFDFLVVNDDFDTAVEDLLSIVRGSRLRRAHQTTVCADLLAKLLA